MADTLRLEDSFWFSPTVGCRDQIQVVMTAGQAFYLLSHLPVGSLNQFTDHIHLIKGIKICTA